MQVLSTKNICLGQLLLVNLENLPVFEKLTQLEITYSNSVMKTKEKHVKFGQSYQLGHHSGQWRHSSFFVVNFEQISHVILMFTLMILNK